jgi:hypothetical protein
MPTDQHALSTTRARWFCPTPGLLLVVLLAVEVILLLNERWFPKGLAVLIGIACIGVSIILMLFWVVIALIFHKRFQFSIRSLLLLTITVAIPSSWLAVEMQQGKRQKKAVEALIKLGGSLKYDFEINSSGDLIQGPLQPGPAWVRSLLGNDFFTSVVYVYLSGMTVTNADVEYLNELTQLNTLIIIRASFSDAEMSQLKGMNLLQELGLSQTQITDVTLEYITSLKQLRSLSVSYTRVTDVGLEHLKGMKLQWLDLSGTQITNAGIQQLKRLEQLHTLDLEYTEITDTGLAYLKDLKELKELDLSYTNVTNTGLIYIKELKQLQTLKLESTKVTNGEVQKLKKALPNLRIYNPNSE